MQRGGPVQKRGEGRVKPTGVPLPLVVRSREKVWKGDG